LAGHIKGKSLDFNKVENGTPILSGSRSLSR